MIKKILITFTFSVLTSFALASGGGVELKHMSPDMSNNDSLQSGLRTYMDYCAGCHSLGYARYNRVAKDLDIPEDIFMDTVISGDAKFGDLMQFSMSVEDGKSWFGVAPPDLTMVTRVRTVDWVYTYLLSFHKDDGRPYGVNNAVMPNVGMPHVLMELQGLCSDAPHSSEGDHVDPLTANEVGNESCAHYSVEGSLDSDEYEEVVYDLVNFLNYMGEPYQQDRIRMGWFVMAFLSVFFVLAVLLQRELFKDIKH